MHETPIEDFERQFRLNLRPTYLLCAAALPRMLEAGGGSIVCVSTRAALRPFAGAAGYIASKAAVLAFVDALAAEYTKDGIRANAILPSVIDTPANRAAQPDADHSRWVTPEADRARDPLPVLGGRGADERRAHPRLRPRVSGPALTVDVAVLAGDPPRSVLLVERANEPFAGAWALPGGFVDDGERVRDAAARELAEETARRGRRRSSCSASTTRRDATRAARRCRSRTSCAPPPSSTPAAATTPREARWWPLEALPALAFDHAQS